MSNNNSETFVSITNQDIYREIQELKKCFNIFCDTNHKQHSEIIGRQDKTNGNVKLSKWIATTALSLTLICIGFLFNHISLALK